MVSIQSLKRSSDGYRPGSKHKQTLAHVSQVNSNLLTDRSSHTKTRLYHPHTSAKCTCWMASTDVHHEHGRASAQPTKICHFEISVCCWLNRTILGSSDLYSINSCVNIDPDLMTEECPNLSDISLRFFVTPVETRCTGSVRLLTHLLSLMPNNERGGFFAWDTVKAH